MPLISLIPLLSTIVPGLIKLIAGDSAGTVAQQVVNVANQMLGTTDDPKAAFNAMSPEQQVQFRLTLAKIEADAEAARRQADLDMLRAELADASNARQRDIELIHMGRPNIRANIMVGGAYATMLGCIIAITLSALKNWALTGEVIALYSTIIVLCGAILKDCSQFEFGTSRSSRDKDSTIAVLAKTSHN